jgi:hypothetical protein
MMYSRFEIRNIAHSKLVPLIIAYCYCISDSRKIDHLVSVQNEYLKTPEFALYLKNRYSHRKFLFWLMKIDQPAKNKILYGIL